MTDGYTHMHNCVPQVLVCFIFHVAQRIASGEVFRAGEVRRSDFIGNDSQRRQAKGLLHFITLGFSCCLTFADITEAKPYYPSAFMKRHAIGSTGRRFSLIHKNQCYEQRTCFLGHHKITVDDP
jgi:hypothetical protein